MIEALLNNLSRALPLTIESVEWADPVLLIGGDEWSLTVSCPWRVVSSAALEFGCWDLDVATRVAELQHVTITDVRRQAVVVAVDPVFALSNGTFLELVSVDAVEPWVLRVAGQVFVASPSDPDAFGELS